MLIFVFASTNVPENEDTITDHTLHLREYIPDMSKWSSYYFDIRDIKLRDPINTPPQKATERVLSLSLGNPTMRSSSSPLFLEFVNNCHAVPRDITVSFSSTDYNVGNSIIIPYGKKVTGILMLDESGEWISFSPWNCEGKPLYSSFLKL